MTDSHLGCTCPDCRRGVSRRDALRLGIGAGAVAAVAPHVPFGAEAAGGAGIDLSTARRLAFQGQSWPPPPIVTREEWGADESLRKPGTTYDSTVQKLIVHHTVTPNNPSDPAAVLRSIYQYAVSREYIDVPYNWLIDQNGRIYEGRWARDYPPGQVHNGEAANGNNVRAAHALNHNARTIGVAFMGTYTTFLPPQPAIDALITLLSWKAARWGIDPLGASVYDASDGTVAAFANVCGHRNVFATTCPGDPTLASLPQLRAEVAARLRAGVFGFWIASRGGRVLAFGDNPDWGDTHRLRLAATIVGVAAHPNGRGYWTFGPDGGIFTFGEAGFYGSTGNIRLHRPIVGMAPTPSGKGYWLVASDGGIFAYGDAKFFGSTGAIRLNQPIVGMASSPTGKGYWLVARDGGIFAFGDAKFRGSAGARGTPQPVVGMVATNTGRGYALLLRDGSVYSYGDAPFYGSAFGQVNDAVGIAGRLVAR